MNKLLKKIFKRNSKPKKAIKYANNVSFVDTDNHRVNIEVKQFGNDKKTLLFISNDKKNVNISLDKETSTLLIAVLSDYIENDNLNNIENICLEEVE